MFIGRTINTVFQSNTWLLESHNEIWLIDCGDIAPLLPFLKTDGGLREVKGVLISHAHFDHIYGLNRLLRLFPTTLIYTNVCGRKALLNDKLNLSHYHDSPFSLKSAENIKILQDGDEFILFNSIKAHVYATPGHHDSCLTYLIGDYLFTGDAYIPGTKVVTVLPGGDKVLASQSVKRILQLSKGHIICPGHGDIFIP